MSKLKELTITNDSQQIDRQEQQKRFLKTIYGDLKIDDSNMIRVVNFYKSGIRESYYTSITDLAFETSRPGANNRYFTLATVKSKGGKTEDMNFRSVLAFDFDKKDHKQELTPYIISRAFTELSIRYCAMVDTGNGYHVYIKINPTTDIDMVLEVQKAIAERLRALNTPLIADIKAMTRTQILRIPATLNCKNEDNFKRVNLVNMNRDSDISVESYYKRFCKYNDYKETSRSEEEETIYTINRNLSAIVNKLLKEGSEHGRRNTDLLMIVPELRRLNYTLSQVKNALETWRVKSKFNDNFDYRVEYIYNKFVGYSEPYRDIGFRYKADEKLIEYNETDTKRLKKSTRKGAINMSGNDLVIYSLLKLHGGVMTRGQIIRDLTYKKVCRFSDKTLTATFESLEDNKFITISLGTDGKTKLYKLIETRNKAELKFNISFSACMECIKKNISTDELRLYTYIRYLHNKAYRENTTKLKGNQVYIDQREIAKDLGITQQRVSKMVINLLEEKLLTFDYSQTSKNNGYDYNVYRLVY